MFLIAFVSQKYQPSTHLKLNAAFKLGDGKTSKPREPLINLNAWDRPALIN